VEILQAQLDGSRIVPASAPTSEQDSFVTGGALGPELSSTCSQMSACSVDSGEGRAGATGTDAASVATVPGALRWAYAAGAENSTYGLTMAQQAAMVGLVSQVETAVLHVATACACAVKVRI
jgi:hypothetical protein